jgi:hypothetical protein
MNLVEIFFGIITRKAIRRGSFTIVADLVRAIRIFIDAWTQRCQPFTWPRRPSRSWPRRSVHDAAHGDRTPR